MSSVEVINIAMCSGQQVTTGKLDLDYLISKQNITKQIMTKPTTQESLSVTPFKT